LAHYIFHRNTILLGPTCYLQDLFTDEAWRGKGIGKGLINAVYEQARIAGSTRVYWQTHESNLTAMKLYGWLRSLKRGARNLTRMRTGLWSSSNQSLAREAQKQTWFVPGGRARRRCLMS
jgi:hypothetical protein